MQELFQTKVTEETRLGNMTHGPSLGSFTIKDVILTTGETEMVSGLQTVVMCQGRSPDSEGCGQTCACVRKCT